MPDPVKTDDQTSPQETLQIQDENKTEESKTDNDRNDENTEKKDIIRQMGEMNNQIEIGEEKDDEEINSDFEDDNTYSDSYDISNISHQVYSYHKKILYKELEKKQEKLSIKIEILRFKYAEYKKWSDLFNLLIIILSSTITLLQSANAEMKFDNYFFTLSPIFISTMIAMLAAVIRFKKWGDKMETISKCISNSILTLSDIKSLKNDIKIATCKEDMDEISDKYKNDVKKSINQTETDIITNLKFIDFVKHMQKFQQYSLRFKDSDGYFQFKQKQIDHKIDIIDELIQDKEEYLQDTYKINTWYCDIYNRLCCCCQNKKNI